METTAAPILEVPVLDKGYVRYLSHMGTDRFICEAARVSYKSTAKSDNDDKRLLARLYKDKHTSPFEMVKIAFNIKMPIFVMRQYIRHRMQNVNEFSARYKELPDEFYIPTSWRAQDTKNKQGSIPIDTIHGGPVLGPGGIFNATEKLQTQCNAAYAVYRNMLDAGIAREMARMILPVNIYTEIYCCWDLKNLLHFFSLRDDSHAQAEIQEYARAMKTITAQFFPWVMELYETQQADKILNKVLL